MEYRRLGGSGFSVPALSFGTATFGGGNDFFRAWGASDASGRLPSSSCRGWPRERRCW